MVVLTIPTVTPEYSERANRRKASEHSEIWSILDAVCDPELPAVTIWDLGILQDIKKSDEGWLIEITLTYSGCPAVNVIKQDILLELEKAGINENIQIDVVLAPAWTTDFISPQGREQLRKINIAAPVTSDELIQCPLCSSTDTEVISEFGSTSCKALYRCLQCREPFDYFKAF